MSKCLQFELWRECNCHCTFCTLGETNLYTPNELKLEALNTAINELKRIKKNEHEVIGFIGGEFFQGQLNTPEIKEKFFELIKITNDLLNKDYIKNIWLNVSLLIGKQEDLYDTLKLVDKKDKLWLLTSYDTLGRFHTSKMFETWEYHMFNIYNLYPEINLNTTSILTGDFIIKYLNDEIKLSEMRKKYHTSLFFKNPVHSLQSGTTLTNMQVNDKIGYFFPKRDDFLKFLKKYLKEEGLFEYDKLISMDLRADEVRKNYNDPKHRNLKFLRDTKNLHESMEGTLDRDLSCGHNDIYASYCDSNKCMLCDKQNLRNFNNLK